MNSATEQSADLAKWDSSGGCAAGLGVRLIHDKNAVARTRLVACTRRLVQRRELR